jgi:hypothetical protein
MSIELGAYETSLAVYFPMYFGRKYGVYDRSQDAVGSLFVWTEQ